MSTTEGDALITGLEQIRDGMEIQSPYRFSEVVKLTPEQAEGLAKRLKFMPEGRGIRSYEIIKSYYC